MFLQGKGRTLMKNHTYTMKINSYSSAIIKYNPLAHKITKASQARIHIISSAKLCYHFNERQQACIKLEEKASTDHRVSLTPLCFSVDGLNF